MQSCYFFLSTLSPLTSFLAATQNPLRPLQFLEMFAVRFRILEHRSVRQCSQRLYAEVDTDCRPLAKEYGAIGIEDLNVSGMLKNHCLAGAINDASFAEIRRQLEYKCKWYGSTLVVHDRFFPSTKMCSQCGFVKATMPLSERVFRCERCGYVEGRDLNAAINQRPGVPRHLDVEELASVGVS